MLINEAEHILALLWRTTWASILYERRAIHSVGNSGVRDSHIHGYTHSAEARFMVGATKMVEAKIGTAVWFYRVASESNPAGEPSRDCHDMMLRHNFRRV